MSDPSAFSESRIEDANRPPDSPVREEDAKLEGVPELRVRGLWSDAWHDLRRRPTFWIGAGLIAIFVLMAFFPQLFTSIDPTDPFYRGDLDDRLKSPDGDHWFGYDLQGRDVYARTVYGANASMTVGVVAALSVGIVGTLLGLTAGYFGSITDTILSRIADIFFGLPFILGAIIVLTTFSDPTKSIDPAKVKMLVIGAIVLLAWPQFFRVMRSSVISVKQSDYIQAARSLGASNTRIIFRHILPNAMAPVLVMGTISIGVFIAAEATLSFLGVGLRPPVISWGVMIDDAKEYIEQAPHMLFFPAAFLSAAVLGFVMLGEAIREAFDPKLR